MLIAYKTEIKPTQAQKTLINQTVGVTRYVANMYLAHNIENYEHGGSFVSATDFSKWLNNTYVPMHEDQSWMKEVSSKAVKQGMLNMEKGFKRFFKGQGSFPKFKKKNDQDVTMYFVKNDKKMIIACERHRIKISTLGYVRLKEFGYIPPHDDNHIIKSGTISRKADKYYVSVLVEQNLPTSARCPGEMDGIGMDLGIKDTAIRSDTVKHKNINKSGRVKKLEKKLKREQRRLSRKYEAEKLRIKSKEIKKGEAARGNIQKQVLKVQRLHQKLTNIRNDFQNKIVSDLAKTKPGYITIEDLNISGMMKNKHLSKAIAGQKLYTLRRKLEAKARQGYFELRMVNRFYPSSKLCSNCGCKKAELKLSDRIYHCDRCGLTIDRDFNASLNLKNATEYKVIA